MIGGRIQRLNRPIITRGLQGRWLCGPKDSQDYSGNGINGDNNPNATWVDARHNTATFFSGDGTDTIANVGTTASFAYVINTGIFSLSFTVKPVGSVERGPLLGSTHTISELGFMVVSETFGEGYGINAMRLLVTSGVSNKFIALGTTDDNTIISDTEQHWCYTVNKSVTYLGQWYRDGVAMTTTHRQPGGTAAGVIAGNCTRPLTIGQAGTWLCDSDIVSDVRMYNVTLTAAEAIAITAGRG